MPTSNPILPPLLGLLRCPENRTPLRMVDAEQLERLSEAAAAGRLRNVAGHLVAEKLEGALVREDGRVVYPIVEGVPRLLMDEGIPLEPRT